MITSTDMRTYVQHSLGDDVADFDVDAIVDDLQQAFGTVDLEGVDHDRYWAIVQRHDTTATDE